MFEGLTEKLERAINFFGKKGRLTPKDVKQGLEEIRKALLEADVNYKVVREFIKMVEAEATGERVLKSFTPREQILKIVYEKLIEILGKHEPLKLSRSPSPIILLGLQGSGKTTTAVKLAYLLRKKGKNPLLVPADVKRPAAFEQLRDLAARYDFPVYDKRLPDAVKLSKLALSMAVLKRYDVVIFDTAGRLHIDEEMIEEARKIRDTVNYDELLLVVDAMTGQDAVNVAREFQEKVGITGVILTKLDGDARGGAALSVRRITGKPIKYIGVGEKVEDLEEFHPERLASRILGMGDLATLREKAKEAIEAEHARRFQEKMLRAELTLEDFLEHIKQIKRMGPIEELIKLLPGGKEFARYADEKMLKKTEAIINSMTPEERRNPKIIDGSRKRRIAKGSGTTVQDVNQLLREYELVVKLMKEMKKGKFPLRFPI